MKTQKKIENWCRDEKFMRYADKRMGEAFNDVVENQPLDPQYEELDEEFEWNDRYVVPLADYLTYRLHLAKLQKNPQNRRSGIWGCLPMCSCWDITCMYSPGCSPRS